MKIITKYKILNKNTIELLEAANIGDKIDLSITASVDLSTIEKAIQDETEKKFEERLKGERNFVTAELEVIKTREIGKKQAEIDKLTIEKLNLEESKKEEIKLEVQKAINKYISEKASLEAKITNLTEKQQDIIGKANLEKTNALLELKQEHNKEIAKFKAENAALNTQNAVLTNQREVKHSKLLGEEFEKWCDQEVLKYVNMTTNLHWFKDNVVKEGTKADYIFDVHSNSNFTPENNIVSVICEMKTTDPMAKNKKKNSDHFSALAKNQANKKCKYAILVSELEIESENDLPIQRAQGYENMYVVRPQYLVPILSFITSISLEYEDSWKKVRDQNVEFKQKQEWLKELEELKEETLNGALAFISQNIHDIISESDKLVVTAGKIKDKATTILNRHLNAAINKIKSFTLKKCL